MSEQQTFIGTVQKSCFTPKEAASFLTASNKDNAEYLERALRYADSEEEAYNDLFAHTSAYIVVDGIVWSIDGAYEENDFFAAHKDHHGKIYIATSFYNGGTCLGELLADYIRKESNDVLENSSRGN